MRYAAMNSANIALKNTTTTWSNHQVKVINSNAQGTNAKQRLQTAFLRRYWTRMSLKSIRSFNLTMKLCWARTKSSVHILTAKTLSLLKEQQQRKLNATNANAMFAFLVTFLGILDRAVPKLTISCIRDGYFERMLISVQVAKH